MKIDKEKIKRTAVSGVRVVKSTAKKTMNGAQPYVEDIAESAKSVASKVSFNRSTKAGGIVGGILGWGVAGTGGVGIAALGGAIGLPVAIVTAVIGAGIGSRVGAEQEKKELIKALEENAAKRNGDSVKQSGFDIKIERIQGKEEHFEALYHAIETATETLCIRSGWISSYVVDNKLEKKFLAALERGVTIYIESGWRRSNQEKASDNKSSIAAKKILSSLVYKSHYQRNGKELEMGKLFVGDVPTHIKEVVVDGEYYISGSNNWLSNAIHSNKEASHIIHAKLLAREIRDETVVSVLSHPSEDIHGEFAATEIPKNHEKPWTEGDKE